MVRLSTWTAENTEKSYGLEERWLELKLDVNSAQLSVKTALSTDISDLRPAGRRYRRHRLIVRAEIIYNMVHSAHYCMPHES
jgi:hypothetical protein